MAKEVRKPFLGNLVNWFKKLFQFMKGSTERQQALDARRRKKRKYELRIPLAKGKQSPAQTAKPSRLLSERNKQCERSQSRRAFRANKRGIIKRAPIFQNPSNKESI